MGDAKGAVEMDEVDFFFICLQYNLPSFYTTSEVISTEENYLHELYVFMLVCFFPQDAKDSHSFSTI